MNCMNPMFIKIHVFLSPIALAACRSKPQNTRISGHDRTVVDTYITMYIHKSTIKKVIAIKSTKKIVLNILDFSAISLDGIIEKHENFDI